MNTILSWELIPLFLIVLANLLLGLGAIKSNPYSKVTRTFTLLVITMSLWSITLFLESEVINPIYIEILIRLDFALGGILCVIFFFFSYYFPKEVDDYLTNKLKYLGSIVVVIFSLLCFTPLIIDDIIPTEVGVTLELGSLFYFYACVLILWLIFGIRILLIKLKSSSGYELQQLKFVILGLTSSAVIVIISNLILPRLYNYGLFVTFVPRLGVYGTTIFIISATYAIARHRLMDIRLAFRQFILKVISILIYVSIFWLTTFLLSQFMGLNQIDFVPYILISIVITALSYDSVEKYIAVYTDGFLFQDTQDKRSIVQNLGESVLKSIKFEEMKDKVERTLKDTFKVDSVEFNLINDIDNTLKDIINMDKKLYVYDEIKREINNTKNDARGQNQSKYVFEYMQDNKLQVLLPLVSTEGVVGVIKIGDKKSGNGFTSNDLEALEVLIYQIGVSVENATLFEEIQSFNIKLNEEVKLATEDLKVRNMRLSILRELDQIILNTRDVIDLSQKIVNLVSWEMGFVGAILVLLHEKNSEYFFQPAAISDTPDFIKAINALPKPLNEYRINWGADPSNLFFRAIQERTPLATETFNDILVPPLTLEKAAEVQKITNIKHLVVYPLSAKGTQLGGIAFGLHKPFKELTHDEIELIEAFMDVIGIGIDSVRLDTELKKRNDDLQKVNEKLRELDKMKDELVSVASHELRTPMTAIKSYLWMALNRETDKLSPKIKGYLERAFFSSDRMIDLVNDMLSASRLEGGRIELNLQAQDIQQLVNEVLDELSPKINEKGLKLAVNKPKTEIPPVLTDNERMHEILVNIIGNAIKYTDRGEVSIGFSLHASGTPNRPEKKDERKEYVWVEVEDSGRGISEEDIPRLFKKFGKLDQGSFTKTAEAGGTGLGLYITKGLIELHGGNIWAESAGEGQGSKFTFSIRIA